MHPESTNEASKAIIRFIEALADIQQAVARLKEAGVHILRGPLEIAGEETWVYFCDVDNNILEYIQ